MLIAICAVVLCAMSAGIGYWRGRLDGGAEMIELITAPARDFIDTWYPLGIPPGEPKNAMDVMAQVLEPLTKL